MSTAALDPYSGNMKYVRKRDKKNLTPKGRVKTEVKKNVAEISLKLEAIDDSSVRAMTNTLAESYPGSASEGAYFVSELSKCKMEKCTLFSRALNVF